MKCEHEWRLTDRASREYTCVHCSVKKRYNKYGMWERWFKNKGWVDFPFQTPTKLTLAVMALESLEERIALLKDYVFNVMQWEQDVKEFIWNRLEKKMRDPKLELEWM